MALLMQGGYRQIRTRPTGLIRTYENARGHSYSPEDIKATSSETSWNRDHPVYKT